MSSAMAHQQHHHHQQDQAVDAHTSSEVGWSFVEQYYSHLNDKPHKLHLFYNKHSAACHGNEGQMVPTLTGQSQIQQRIKEHNFSKCKVMISNVDCQGSRDDGVVLQVLGEMANADQPSQKFVQTFYLAKQQTGAWFVLNDILRFLKEDVEDDEGEKGASTANSTQQPPQQQSHQQASPVAQVQAQAPPAKAQAPTQPTSTLASSEPAVVAATTPVPAKQETSAQAPVEPVSAAPAAIANGSVEQPKVEQKAAVEKEEPAQAPKAPIVEEEAAIEAIAEGVATPSAAISQPSPQSAPSGPVSWAAALKKPGSEKPASSAAAAATAAATTVSSSPTAAQKPAARLATPAAPVSAKPNGHATSSASRPAANSNNAAGNKYSEFHSAYIKNVSQRVDEDLLEKKLAAIGSMTHFQVAKEKNCAFVDFIDEETLQRALAVHELKVGDHTVLIEVRKRGGAKKFNKNGNQPSKGGFTGKKQK